MKQFLLMISLLGLCAIGNAQVVKQNGGNANNINGSFSVNGTTNTGANFVVNSTGVYAFGETDGIKVSTGYVGEFINAIGSPSILKASTAYLALATMTLTAGDYNVSGTCPLNVGGTTAMTAMLCAISTSNTSPDITSQNAIVAYSGVASVSTSLYLTVGPRQVNISATTTYYLIMAVTYSVLGGATLASTDVGMAARRMH